MRKETFVDFYKGADGLTILINIQEFEWLKWLREAITKLGNNVLQTIDLLNEKV